jgi:hypothetical protein
MALSESGITNASAFPQFARKTNLPVASFTQQLRQKLAGVRCLARRDLFGCAARDQFASLVASLRAEVDDVIGRLDHVQVVLDHHDRMPAVNQSIQAFQQAIDVGEMQTGRRFVENVQVVFAAFELAKLPGELDALGFATG